MSWGDIFFGFRGRINRKTYWAGSLAVVATGLLFVALLAYLATGNPLAPEVLERPADKANLWVLVWLAYFGFLVWPLTALTVKRLHDRDRPVWVWYVSYILSLIACLVPLRASLGSPLDTPFTVFGIPQQTFLTLVSFLLIAVSFFAGYLFIQLGVLRGEQGPNRYGDDPLPLDYNGGDYNNLSLLFAIEGRISRLKWWLGVFILLNVFLVLCFIIGVIFGNLFDRYPELTQHFEDPAWLNSKEAQPIIDHLSRWMIGPMLALALVLWSIFALSMKRLHDRGLSGWLILVVVVPFFGALTVPTLADEFQLGEKVANLARLLLIASLIWSVLEFGILKGETGSNEHGPDPLAG